jgi:hypothetical protein
VHTRPRCATPCATRGHCKIHCAHAAKVCYTLQSCATRGQCEIHCAHSAKVCYTPQSCGTRNQGVLHATKLCNTPHLAKVCYTLQSCATGHRTRPRCATRCKAVHTRPMRNSLCTGGQGVLHAAKLCNTPHSPKVCYTLQSCVHAANAKFTVHTRPRCATRRKAVQHAALGQGVLHAAKLCNRTPHLAKVCYRLQSCATRRQCKIHCAHAAKVCYTPQSCAIRSTRQGVLRAAKLCKLCNRAKLCNTLQSCATGGQAVQHARGFQSKIYQGAVLIPCSATLPPFFFDSLCCNQEGFHQATIWATRKKNKQATINPPHQWSFLAPATSRGES